MGQALLTNGSRLIRISSHFLLRFFILSIFRFGFHGNYYF